MQIDYYFSLNSPWTYLGHDRLIDIARQASVTVVPYPVDIRDTIFPNSGGLPVTKRPPARQAYRLQELERWRTHLKVPLNIRPKFWPANEVIAETLLIAVRESGDIDGCLKLAGLLMRCVWERDLDIGDRSTLASIVWEAGLDDALVDNINDDELVALRITQSQQALERGIFGAPSYVIGDQILWGQDRLEFVQRMVQKSA